MLVTNINFMHTCTIYNWFQDISYSFRAEATFRNSGSALVFFPLYSIYTFYRLFHREVSRHFNEEKIDPNFLGDFQGLQESFKFVGAL